MSNNEDSLKSNNIMLQWIRNKLNPSIATIIDEEERSSSDIEQIQEEITRVHQRQREIAIKLRTLRLEADVISRKYTNEG